MAAYVVVGVDVHNAEAYSDYTREVPTTLEPFGGRFLVRGGAFEVVEGEWPAARIVVLTFPTVEQAHQWHASPAYGAILPIRKQQATTHFLVIVEGVG